MKKTVIFLVLLVAMACVVFAQNLPKLAVVEFEVNSSRQKVKEDAIAIRNLVRTNIVSSNKFVVVTRDEIDKLLANQKIQVSSISSAENLKKLQMTTISYIVTGTVDAMDNDYSVTISLLDVSNGQISCQTSQFMSNASADIYDKTAVLVSKFQKDLSTRPGKTYKIGDIGPAGGFVFYDKGYISDGWRYLEAAPPGTEFFHEINDIFKGDGYNQRTEVGSGKRNTQYIVEQLNKEGKRNYVAQRCVEMDINGYKDWFLPSIDELDLMYKNLKQKGLGGFKDYNYGSSSMNYDDGYEMWLQWYQDFANGEWSTYFKGVGVEAYRAIRAF